MLNVTEAEGLRIASATDVGRKRSGNEDSHAVWVPEDADERARRGVLFMVADGMGGANAGEVASGLAAEVVVHEFRERADVPPEEALRGAIEAANSRIHSQAGSQADQRGMGTTCTAVVVRGHDVWVGHVGDSRAYLVRGGAITHLTRDHSLVAELVERGHLTAADAKHDPRRNVVTRSVGATDDVVVDADHAEQALRPGDAVVVCSDGLHGQVTDDEIAHLAGEHTPEEACQLLIDLANDRGGPDNITVIVARVEDAGAAAATDAAGAAAKPRPRAPLPLLVLLLLLVLGAVVLVGNQMVRALRAPSSGTTPANPTAPPVAGGEPSTTPAPDDGKPSAAAPSPGSLAQPVADAHPQAQVEKPVPVPAPVTRAPVPPPAAPSKAAAAPAGHGTLFVTTQPFQPCDFFIDGKPFSEAVGSIQAPSLAAGAHHVKVVGHDGTAEFDVQLVASGVLERVATLPGADAVGDVEVAVTGAAAARILIDGAQYPTLAPCTVHGLAPGEHQIRAIGQGANPQVVSVSVVVAPHGSGRVEVVFPASH